jgi:hypothetical protein
METACRTSSKEHGTAALKDNMLSLAAAQKEAVKVHHGHPPPPEVLPFSATSTEDDLQQMITNSTVDLERDIFAVHQEKQEASDLTQTMAVLTTLEERTAKVLVAMDAGFVDPPGSDGVEAAGESAEEELFEGEAAANATALAVEDDVGANDANSTSPEAEAEDEAPAKTMGENEADTKELSDRLVLLKGEASTPGVSGEDAVTLRDQVVKETAASMNEAFSAFMEVARTRRMVLEDALQASIRRHERAETASIELHKVHQALVAPPVITSVNPDVKAQGIDQLNATSILEDRVKAKITEESTVQRDTRSEIELVASKIKELKDVVHTAMATPDAHASASKQAEVAAARVNKVKDALKVGLTKMGDKVTSVKEAFDKELDSLTKATEKPVNGLRLGEAEKPAPKGPAYYLKPGGISQGLSGLDNSNDLLPATDRRDGAEDATYNVGDLEQRANKESIRAALGLDWHS